jgi:signal transduction histidine kinase
MQILPSLTPEMLVPRLGDYLVEHQYITNEQLQVSLQTQADRKKKGDSLLLGRVLVEMGYIDQNRLDQAITEQILRLRNALQESNQQLEERVKQRTKELENALDELSRLSKAKTAFISNISHELRTPLTHIKGYLPLMIDSSLGPTTEDQMSALVAMMNASNRLEKLIDDLILFANMDRGVTSILIKTVNVQDLCIDALSQMQPKARDKDITLSAKYPEENVQMFADYNKISWVIRELIENAIKFTDSGGRVVLGFIPEGPLVRVFVRDTGMGIPHDRVHEVFEPFHQLDGSTTRKQKGVGLGLALVKQIIDAHESTVEVDSLQGQGSTFSFCLKAVNA